MRVYFDIFTQDELLCDSYPIAMLYNDTIMEVSTEQRDYGEQIDEEENEIAVLARYVHDFCNRFHLTRTAFTKKDYSDRIKTYMQQVKRYLEENNSDRVRPLIEGFTAFVKQVLSEFDQYEFYINENFADESMIILARSDEDDYITKFYYIRDGLEEREG